MLYTLNLYSAVCQLCLSKNRGKKKIQLNIHKSQKEETTQLMNQ